jgi:hypothetical protein
VKIQMSDVGHQRSEHSLEVYIEELVLHGFAPCDRYVIGEAVERELALLLGNQDVPNALQFNNATDEIRGATFNTPRDAKPPIIGGQIAAAVYQAFGQ